jgi:hypothetical protein
VSALVLLLNLVVWGGHTLLPFRLAADSAAERERRLWALAALPALGLSVVLTAVAVGLDPEPAVAWSLHDLAAGSRPALAVAVAVAAVALADLLGLLGWRGFEATAWRLWGGVGALGLAAVTTASELVRIGWGPVGGGAALAAAALLRAPLALAAAEIVAGAPRWATPLAGLGLPAAVALWPAPLRAALGADRLTIAAAVLLLLAARWLPARLRRLAGAAGVLLAAIFLARAGHLSQVLGTIERSLAGAGGP